MNGALDEKEFSIVRVAYDLLAEQCGDSGDGIISRMRIAAALDGFLQGVNGEVVTPDLAAELLLIRKTQYAIGCDAARNLRGPTL